MSPFRILVVDDEELARERLRVLLAKYADGAAHIPSLSGALSLDVDFACDGIEAIEKIRQCEPQVVVLDIQMPEVSGFDVLLQFPERRFEVVFQTAFSEFALKAFDVAAVDYLLKPFPPERLYQALNRALSRVVSAPQGPLTAPTPTAPESLSAERTLVEALRSQRVHLENIAVRAGTRVRMVPVSEVHYFLSEDHVTTLFTEEFSFACDPSLSALEERLDPHLFLRIHRNAIVNLREVASFTLESNATLTLKSGVTLKVSRERKKDLRALLDEDPSF
ncbi:MAG: LytTR family transcriptional regulator DNA-binding domain-containing protein [Silvanigrellales bacterium]|nr:LytTR family transcriptional regulator DNA-binding domain-containing protein [Silvanigrellales bacterium]